MFNSAKASDPLKDGAGQQRLASEPAPASPANREKRGADVGRRPWN